MCADRPAAQDVSFAVHLEARVEAAVVDGTDDDRAEVFQHIEDFERTAGIDIELGAVVADKEVGDLFVVVEIDNRGDTKWIRPAASMAAVSCGPGTPALQLAGLFQSPPCGLIQRSANTTSVPPWPQSRVNSIAKVQYSCMFSGLAGERGPATYC